MSIYERTKEIGIIKVLGCDMRKIRDMFLIESGLIGLIGGEQILLKPLNNINSKYLFYLSKVFRFQLQLRAAGIKVYRFKISDLKKIYKLDKDIT